MVDRTASERVGAGTNARLLQEGNEGRPVESGSGNPGSLPDPAADAGNVVPIRPDLVVESTAPAPNDVREALLSKLRSGRVVRGHPTGRYLGVRRERKRALAQVSLVDTPAAGAVASKPPEGRHE
jgi:hypothetical protein